MATESPKRMVGGKMMINTLLQEIILTCMFTCWLTIGITTTIIIVAIDFVRSKYIRANWKCFLKENIWKIIFGFFRGVYSFEACLYVLTHDGNEYTKMYGFTSVF